MGKGDSLFDLFIRKILRFRSQTEGLTADIDRIRTVNHGGLQHLETSSRNKQFCLSHLFTSLSLKTLNATPSPMGMIDVARLSVCFNSYKYSRMRAWIVLLRRSTA